MTIKMTVELPEEHLRYAEKLVAEGLYPSISHVLEAGIDQLIAASADDPLAVMTDDIRRRMELPKDQWSSLENGNLFDRVRERLKIKHGSR